ncbi:MAG: hypothetical protein LBD11_01510 [Candidatus Peribacteria bacterium]|jgi:glycyl-tRNA synthetase beta subunit|nr:hypothetical protein [Candidatus Peribacteria bacterium]
MEITHLLPTKKTEKNSIFNFYYSKKEKGRKDISQENVDSLILKFPYNKSITSKSKEISFNREVYFDKEIRITLDTITSIVNGPTLTYVMEVKVYKDINALIKVMEYIISKGNKHLTTYGKYDLI